VLDGGISYNTCVKIIKEYQEDENIIVTLDDYIKLCDNNVRLNKEPCNVSGGNNFKWIHYLGLNISKYPKNKVEWKTICVELNIGNIYDYYKCVANCILPPRFIL
jgi:hypothetical protein